MNEDINAALEEARGDLQSIGCTFIYKGCQNVDTVSKYILLGVPKSIDKDEIKKVTDRRLKALEKQMATEDPDNFPAIRESTKWIDYAITQDMPTGMPWEDTKPGQRRQNTSFRNVFFFQCKTEDQDRLDRLLWAAKGKKVWHEE